MTNKEELIRAAELLKKYCEKHIDTWCTDCEECLFSYTCSEFLQYDSIGAIMTHFINSLRLYE